MPSKARVESLRYWIEDTWHLWTYRGPYEAPFRQRVRYRIGQTLCSLRIHKIEFWDVASYEAPADPYWHCYRCGHERLPYRSVFWRSPFWQIAHPIQALRSRDHA